jgi:glycosyltransferase involved in cell wall biosynthesis
MRKRLIETSRSDLCLMERLVILNPWDRLIGPNRYLIEILRNSPHLAQRAIVVCNSYQGAEQEYDDLGIVTAVWPEIAPVHPNPSLSNCLRVLKCHTFGLIRVIRRLNAVRPSIIISNSEILWIGGLAAKILKIPHIQVFHSVISQYRLKDHPYLWHLYGSFLSRIGDCFIGVSQTLTEDLKKVSRSGTHVISIPNPIPSQDIEHASREPVADEFAKAFEGRYPILLCAGRIGQMKGQDYAIEVLKILKNKYPEIIVLFAGQIGSAEGKDDTIGFYNQLKGLIHRESLERHVCFLGEVANLPSLLRRADVCIQPSRMESFCRVVAESLVVETPVVAFSVGGIPEAGGPGVYLVPPGNPRLFAQKVLSVLENYGSAKVKALKGKEYVYQSFDPVRIAGMLESVVADLLNEKAKRLHRSNPARS